MNTNSPSPKKPLKDKLFERIETEHVCPRSRLFFQGRECVVWSFWFISVFVGALAVAVSVFVVSHHQYELYEATHDNFFTFMVEVLPYLWIIMFGLMSYIAIYNLRHTKNGYRHPVWFILLSSVVLSFAGGAALHYFGFGYSVDNILGNQMSIYTSQNRLEQKLWQNPRDGRLLGRQVFSTLAPTSTIVFEDTSGQRWRMDVTELHERDLKLLASEQPVRLLGKMRDGELRLFHACGAFPRMLQKEVTMEEMILERQKFIEEVNRHSKRDNGRMALLEATTFASTTLPRQSVCAQIAAVKRVGRPDNF